MILAAWKRVPDETSCSNFSIFERAALCSVGRREGVVLIKRKKVPVSRKQMVY